jgi:hypothetical protein
MTMDNMGLYILLGCGAGLLSGVVGIGGGVLGFSERNLCYRLKKWDVK